MTAAPINSFLQGFGLGQQALQGQESLRLREQEQQYREAVFAQEREQQQRQLLEREARRRADEAGRTAYLNMVRPAMSVRPDNQPVVRPGSIDLSPDLLTQMTPQLADRLMAAQQDLQAETERYQRALSGYQRRKAAGVLQYDEKFYQENEPIIGHLYGQDEIPPLPRQQKQQEEKATRSFYAQNIAGTFPNDPKALQDAELIRSGNVPVTVGRLLFDRYGQRYVSEQKAAAKQKEAADKQAQEAAAQERQQAALAVLNDKNATPEAKQRAALDLDGVLTQTAVTAAAGLGPQMTDADRQKALAADTDREFKTYTDLTDRVARLRDRLEETDPPEARRAIENQIAVLEPLATQAFERYQRNLARGSQQQGQSGQEQQPAPVSVAPERLQAGISRVEQAMQALGITTPRQEDRERIRQWIAQNPE